MNDVLAPRELVVISVNGSEAVSADVVDGPDCVELTFHCTSRPAPAAAHAELVAAVFALPMLHPHAHLRASLPVGETTLLQEITHHCASARARAAGATCLIDGVVAGKPAV